MALYQPIYGTFKRALMFKRKLLSADQRIRVETRRSASPVKYLFFGIFLTLSASLSALEDEKIESVPFMWNIPNHISGKSWADEIPNPSTNDLTGVLIRWNVSGIYDEFDESVRISASTGLQFLSTQKLSLTCSSQAQIISKFGDRKLKVHISLPKMCTTRTNKFGGEEETCTGTQWKVDSGEVSSVRSDMQLNQTHLDEWLDGETVVLRAAPYAGLAGHRIEVDTAELAAVMEFIDYACNHPQEFEMMNQ